MEGGDNILEAIYSDDNLDDVEMLDVEEGEFVEQIDVGQNSSKDINIVNQDSENKEHGQDVDIVNQDTQSKNRRRRANKKKNKKRKSGPGPNGGTDINRFVLDTCRQLKEKKSYMVYTAVGCLGLSALSDIVNEILYQKPFNCFNSPVLCAEVNVIQSCGGQRTADGRRHRNGGGILWNIIKTREPNAYKEIMKKAKEFEKQFRQQSVGQAPVQKKGSDEVADAGKEIMASFSEGSQQTPPTQNQNGQSNAEGKRVPVHDRIRVPVSYADLVEECSKDDEPI